MTVKLLTEKWIRIGKPTAGESYYFNKKGKRIWFTIIEQGWTKSGVYLKLTKK